MSAPLFDTSSMTPMQRGRIEKHLSTRVRYRGEVTTNADMYRTFGATHKAIKKVTKYNTRYNAFGARIDGEPYEVLEYRLCRDDFLLDIPKLLFEACTLPVLEKSNVNKENEG